MVMPTTTTLTSITSLSQTLSTINNPSDVSLSSYLNTEEETFILKLAESGRVLMPKSTIQEVDHSDRNHQQYHAGKDKEEEGEIGVFSAEKYFNGGMDEDSPRLTNMVAVPRNYYQPKIDVQRKTSEVVVGHVKPKLHPGKPSIKSQSSYNSQSALIQSSLRTPSRRRTNKVQGKSLLAAFGRKCACSDKNSVDVHEVTDEVSYKKAPGNSGAIQQQKAITKEPIKISLDLNQPNSGRGSWIKEEKRKNQYCQDSDKLGIGLNKENCFSFPAVSSHPGNLPVKMQVLKDQEKQKPRKSLEVFGSPVVGKRSKPLALEIRPTMLSWDAFTPGMEGETEISASSSGRYNNDNDSDASSDLFEIESITGKVTPFLAKQGSDGTSGCLTPTTCYAPSEASIEWSVVTASAADFSVISDYDPELKTRTTAGSPMRVFPRAENGKNMNRKELPRPHWRSGILLGCNSQKAVRVAGDAQRAYDRENYEPRIQRMSDSSYLPAVTRFQAEGKLTGYAQLHALATATTHSLPHSRSPNGSRLLYV